LDGQALFLDDREPYPFDRQEKFAHAVLSWSFLPDREVRLSAVDKAGRAMSIAFTVFMLYGPDGQVTACGSVIRDETERFAADRALKKRLAELEALLPPDSTRS